MNHASKGTKHGLCILRPESRGAQHESQACGVNHEAPGMEHASQGMHGSCFKRHKACILHFEANHAERSMNLQHAV